MPELHIKQSLNKAFIKVRPERTQIEKFKSNFVHLLDEINTNSGEREEFLKNIVSDFFKNTWYAPTYYINTSGTIDLVIHENNTAQSPISVIIETKTPANKSEMITKDDLNKKALQEVLLYYLRERIGNNNIGIKYLIITNTVEWFIFDGTEFETHFAVDKKLTQLFNDYNNKRLLDDGTGFFYKEIAAQYIERVKDKLNYNYFNIKDYEKILKNNDKNDDNKLIALYKLLSPQHLLKLPFENDSNTLNQNFYSELLYIMGLSEEKEGAKKVIVRPKDAMRNPATLIEQTMFNLGNYSIENNQLFETALELVITWINRILFLKLLESQEFTYQKENADYSFLNIDKVTSFNDLNTLFFQVLAREPKNRADNIKERFKNIPYLNSSLFDMTDKETLYFSIQVLQSDEIPVFSATVLKDNSGKKLTGKTNCLKYIFEFLNAYDFTSEGKEEIQEDNKTLINASVLGLIFEKINGYKDGSFFTPGFITTYICRETLRPVVINKFNEVKNWKALDFKELKKKINNSNDDDIIEQANSIINSITVCDPSVGSGHFLVSALNEIIAIKSELGVLADSDGMRLKGYSAEVVNDELMIFNEDHDFFVYNYKNEESRRIQKTIFEEKQKIIEGSLFGVDINPNSVKICRLRLWIELLKNAYYTEESGFTELETLPNIDINIKCGNSLISRLALDIDLKSELKKLKYTVKDYQEAVHSYKNATNKSEKKKLEELITKIKSNFSVEIGNYDSLRIELKNWLLDIENLKQVELFELTVKEKAAKEKKIKEIGDKILAVQTKLEEKENGVIYENAFEWRFEFPEVLDDDGNFKGFDAVIGNPPYGVSVRDEYRKTITNWLGNVPDYEIYYYFIEIAKKLLEVSGFVSYIIPNTYLFNTFAENYRESILKNWNAIEILDCTKFKIFDSATVFNTIILFQNGISNLIGYHNTNNVANFVELARRPRLQIESEKLQIMHQNWSLAFNLQPEIIKLINKIITVSKSLEAYFPLISQGLIAYDKYKGQDEDTIKNRIYHHLEFDKKYKKWLWGEDVKRYSVTWNSKEYLDYCDGIANPRKPVFFTTKRILIREITNPSIYAALTQEESYNDPSILNIVSSESYSLEVLLGILNSKLATFYHFNHSPKATKGAFPKILVQDIKEFPLPKISEEQETSFVTIVSQILTAKSVNSKTDTTELENQVDKIVYGLYGLTDDEIKVVEGKK